MTKIRSSSSLPASVSFTTVQTKDLVVTGDTTWSREQETMFYVGRTGNAPFLNSWVNYDAVNFQSAAYWKDAVGMVHLQGLIKNGTLSAAAFTLPKSYRPINYAHFVVLSNASFGGCRVTGAGDVLPVEGSNAWFSLDGISFKASKT